MTKQQADDIWLICRVRMDAAKALGNMVDLRTNSLMGLQALLQSFRERLIDSATSEVLMFGCSFQKICLQGACLLNLPVNFPFDFSFVSQWLTCEHSIRLLPQSV